ncbi:MAG: hypothetical protein ACC657_12285 [Thiohalomonadales bacterium]
MKIIILTILIILVIFIGYSLGSFNSSENKEDIQLILDNIQEINNKILTLNAYNKNTDFLLIKIQEKQEFILNNLLVDKSILQAKDELKNEIIEEDEELSNTTTNNVLPAEGLANLVQMSPITELDASFKNQQFVDRFLSETVDVEWGDTVNLKLEQLLSDKYLFGSQYISKECKSSICRVEIVHDSVEAKQMFNQKFQSTFKWQGTSKSSSVSNGDGKIKSTLFLLR